MQGFEIATDDCEWWVFVWGRTETEDRRLERECPEPIRTQPGIRRGGLETWIHVCAHL